MITYCPFCHHRHNAWTDISKPGVLSVRPPKPGDVSLCIMCGSVSLYDDRLDLRKPSRDEWDEIKDDERVKAGLQAWREMRALRKL